MLSITEGYSVDWIDDRRQVFGKNRQQMATAQVEIRTDWPTPRHIPAREVRVLSETSSLAPIRLVKQKWECLEEDQHYYQMQAPAAANAAFICHIWNFMWLNNWWRIVVKVIRFLLFCKGYGSIWDDVIIRFLKASDVRPCGLVLVLGTNFTCISRPQHIAKCSSLQPSGHYMYRTVVTIRTTSFIIQQFHVLPTPLYLCVLCGSQNKQPLFPYTALTDWFV
jgi:hypothetical protein